MGGEPRLTQQSLRVLKAFLDAPNTPMAGADIMKAAGIASGTMYPILLRLWKQGWLDREWESESAEKLGRPRRRYYSLTPDGRVAAYDALSEFRSAPAMRPVFVGVQS
jgi:DNA-binding PadR family transcriptional regulator